MLGLNLEPFVTQLADTFGQGLDRVVDQRLTLRNAARAIQVVENDVVLCHVLPMVYYVDDEDNVCNGCENDNEVRTRCQSRPQSPLMFQTVVRFLCHSSNTLPVLSHH